MQHLEAPRGQPRGTVLHLPAKNNQTRTDHCLKVLLLFQHSPASQVSGCSPLRDTRQERPSRQLSQLNQLNQTPCCLSMLAAHPLHPANWFEASEEACSLAATLCVSWKYTYHRLCRTVKYALRAICRLTYQDHHLFAMLLICHLGPESSRGRPVPEIEGE